MDRINIYIPHDLRQRIKLRAEQARQPEAEAIRTLLTQALEANTPAGNPLLDLATQAVKGGPPDLSLKIDKYLYETNNK